MRSLLLILYWLPLMAVEAPGITIRERTVDTTVQLVVQAEAKRSEVLKNPVGWRPVADHIENGSWVDAGDVVVRFDPGGLEEQLEERLLDQKTRQAELQHRLGQIDDESTQLRERLADVRNELSVHRARLQALAGLPIAADVQLAKGRLTIARLQADEQELARDRARRRLQQDFISEVAFDRIEADWRRAQARLENAELAYRQAQKPADPLEIEKVQISIDGLEREVEKLEHDLAQQENIARIEKERAISRSQRIDRKIEELRENLESLEVKAPIDGYLVYTDRFLYQLESQGGKMWETMVFARIPDLDTMAFRGFLPESQRSLVQKGDSVSLSIVGSDGLVAEGVVQRFSAVARDINDIEDSDFQEFDSDSGIKVYEVFINCPDAPDWVRPGVHAQAVIQADAAKTGPAVPLDHVAFRDDAWHLALDGVFREIGGQTVGDWFFLDEDHHHLVGERVVREGAWPLVTERVELTERDDDDGAALVGELEPVHQHKVFLGELPGWTKVEWVVDENTMVAAGDEILRLEDEDLSKQIEERRTELEETQKATETARERLELKRRDAELRLQRERDGVRQAEIDYLLVANQDDALKIADAELQLELATIALAEAEAVVQRLQSRRQDLVSERDQREAQRTLKRRQLAHEEATIRLRLAKLGPDPVRYAKAKATWQRAQLKLETLEERAELDTAHAERQVWRNEKRQRWRQGRLDRDLERQANLTVVADRDGMVQLQRTWTEDGVRKLSAGASVRSYQHVLSIVDIDEMAVRLAVPELYFPSLETGMRLTCIIPALGNATVMGTLTEVDFLFEERRRSSQQGGLYADQEPLGEAECYARIRLDPVPDLKLLPNMVVQVRMPRTLADTAHLPVSRAP